MRSFGVGHLALCAVIAGCESPSEPVSGELRVSGLVLDGQTGEPVPDVTVGIYTLRYFGDYHFERWIVDETRTDAAGSFELVGPTIEGIPCAQDQYFFALALGQGIIDSSLEWDGLDESEDAGIVQCGLVHQALLRLEFYDEVDDFPPAG